MTDTTYVPVKPNPADQFTAMAAKIETNHENGFSGACVIYPPSGEPIAMLMLDDKADPALFLATVKSKIEMAIMDLDEKQKSSPYGYR